MLPFNFDYYRPKTAMEAVQWYEELSKRGKTPVYFSGGTEILTLGRLNLLSPLAVIDIKSIRECNAMNMESGYLVTGAALSLTKVEEANLFPLLSKAASGVADHTSRNKITVGGNLCGRIFYREAVLPFLLSDSKAIIVTMNETKESSIQDVFQKEIQLKKGELLLQLHTEQKYLNMPFVCVKKRQQWDTGYPLLTIAAIRVEDEIRVAISGLCPFPFRSQEMEKELNNRPLSLEERLNKAMAHLPKPVLDDVEGSASYRLFVLKNMLYDIIQKLENEMG